MQIAELQRFLENSEAVRLLRSHNAAHILVFLASSFQDSDREQVMHGELIEELISFQQKLHLNEPDSLTEPSANYLEQWTAPPTQYLRRTLTASNDEAAYTLSAGIRHLFRFIHQSQNESTRSLGTESHLQIILQLLGDVAVQSDTNPRNRIEALRHQQRQIQQQIRALESGERLQKYNDAQIRERFSLASEMLSNLTADFRALEDRFRQMTRQIQQRQMAKSASRGDIIESALNEEALLREHDEGRSFYEFVRIVHSPDKQAELAELIDELRQIEAISEHRGMESIQNLLPTLLREAERVLQTTQHLSTVLRRLLDSRLSNQRRQLASVIGELLEHATNAATESISLESPPLIGNARLELGFQPCPVVEREFWQPEPSVPAVDLHEVLSDSAQRDDAFEQLENIESIDWQQLQSNIDDAFSEWNQNEITLQHLLQQHPPTCGIVEVLVYLQIAFENNHTIEMGLKETISVTDLDGSEISLTVPRVCFLRESKANVLINDSI